MIRSELIINGTRVDLKSEFGCAITYAIADIKKPETRNGSLSKTVKLPGTKTINNLLTNIYDINYDIQTSGAINFTPDFNPNLKASVYVYTDGLLQFSGYMKLLNINRDQADLERKEYEVLLIGEVATIYSVIADGKLSDLDLSAYDHTYNKATQQATWTNTNYGTGYVYPMINYGGIPANTWAVENFYTAIYIKTIVDAIFSDAGWVYSSTFFDSALFKRLVLPFAGDKLTITAASIAARLFSASLSGNIDDSVVISSTSIGDSVSEDPVLFNAESSDPSNQFDTGTGIFTATNAGYYDFYTSGTYSCSATTDTTFSTSANFSIQLAIKVVSGATTSTYPIGGFNGLTPAFNPAGSNLYSQSIQGISQTIYMNAGDTANLTSLQNIAHASGASGTINFRIASGAVFKNRITNTAIVDGNSLSMSSVLPPDIRQADFLTAIFRTFNLYVEPDRSQPNKLIIETETDFYESGSTRDWSLKLDVSRPVTITPMGALDALRYVLKYSDDTDFWNKTYKDKFKETYGQKNVDIVNDFLKNVNTNEVMFAATPLVGSASHDRIIPEIYTLTNAGVQQPIKSKLRLLYWAGTFNTGYSWTYTSTVTGNTTETTYPYAGHLDNPYNPTIDLSFGVPQEIYYANPYGATQYGNNTLYNVYHSQYITEITDRNSKLVTAYFRLKPLDIFDLSFRDIIYIDGQNYRLNKVIDYDPASYSVTKVELLKIKHAPAFVPTTKFISFATGEVIDLTRSDYEPGNGTNVGTGDLSSSSLNASYGSNNYIASSSRGVTVSGSNIRVGNNCTNVSVFNSSGVVVMNDLRNVSVIATNDITITESDVSYQNGVKISGSSEWTSLTATQTISAPGNYTTTGTITITLTPGSLRSGDTFVFKKLDGGASILTINGGGVNIDGAATTTATTQYSSLTIKFSSDDNKFYIVADKLI